MLTRAHTRFHQRLTHVSSAAAENLAKVRVPQVARLLDTKQLLPVNAADLKIILHERGINLRFLGLLRSHCKDIYVRNFLLTVMLNRIINQQVRLLASSSVNALQLLKKLRKVRGTAKAEYVDVAIGYFNLVLGACPHRSFWCVTLSSV